MQFLEEMECDAFSWVVLPVPYEETTSYLKGTSSGPASILEASSQLEVYDPAAGREAIRATGIYTDDEWSFGGSLLEIGKRVEYWLGEKKRVFSLGGEHTITVPIISAYREYYPDFAVLHVDAHADLRDVYEGSRLSHACAMRRVIEHVPVYSLGLRAYSEEEARILAERKIPHLHAWEMEKNRVREFIDNLPERIYLSFDVDVFDPSEVPAVGTPQPGGITYRMAADMLEYLLKKRDVVGVDVVETRPVQGLEYGVFTIASLCHFILGRV